MEIQTRQTHADETNQTLTINQTKKSAWNLKENSSGDSLDVIVVDALVVVKVRPLIVRHFGGEAPVAHVGILRRKWVSSSSEKNRNVILTAKFTDTEAGTDNLKRHTSSTQDHLKLWRMFEKMRHAYLANN